MAKAKAKATPETATVEDRATISINDVLYYQDSLTEEAIQMIETVNLIQGEIEKFQLNANIAIAAKDTFIKNIEDIADQFEKVENTETKAA